MAFTHATASYGARTKELLSADNAVPERHIVMETLRNAAPRLGLKAPVLATLDAMLSCLPPKRSHHTVFASNETLMFRRDGLSDRTIRRHVAILQEHGLLERRDSANGKRFTRLDRHRGVALRFGFDLTPLFDRLHEIAVLAAEALREKEELAYLRAQIRAAANQILRQEPESSEATDALRILRRKLTVQDCQTLLCALQDQGATSGTEAAYRPLEAEEMAGNDGQNVRHHQKSKKENTDKKEAEVGLAPAEPAEDISLKDLLAACPEAAEFSMKEIQSFSDVIAHAQTLAPMIGVDRQNYQAAQARLGPLGTAVTIWGLVQGHDRIQRAGAYFRAITTGSRSEGFSPVRLVKRLAMAQESAGQTGQLSADNFAAGCR